jgi:hypothetical protein
MDIQKFNCKKKVIAKKMQAMKAPIATMYPLTAG